MPSDLDAYAALRQGDVAMAQALAVLAVAENVNELSTQLFQLQQVLERIEQRIPME